MLKQNDEQIDTLTKFKEELSKNKQNYILNYARASTGGPGIHRLHP